MKTIKIYCGKTVEKKCREQRHPANEVLAAKELVESEHDVIAFSNSTDFIMAIKYIAKKKNIPVEFFLDGVSHGDDIEPIFKSFNEALDMINEFGATEE